MHEITSFVMLILLWAAGWYLWRKVEERVGKWLFPWIRPVLETLFPVFKLTPWLFEPIEGSDIPDKQRRFFQTHTPAFLARRFTHLGDFVLRRDASILGREGEPSCCRYFLSPDGTVIGGLTCYLGAQTIDCMSVLLDGTYLETANTPCGKLPPKKHGLQFFIIQTQDAFQVIDHHLASMARAAAENSTQPAPLTAGDLQAVSNYGRELSLRSLFQQGVLAELPEFLRLKRPAAAAPAST
jgi:hypothetical protein